MGREKILWATNGKRENIVGDQWEESLFAENHLTK